MDTTTVEALIKIAAETKVKLEIMYEGEVRVVEPYSYRIKATGNTLFYAYCDLRQAIRGFNLAKIESAHITTIPYEPRWTVEIHS